MEACGSNLSAMAYLFRAETDLRIGILLVTGLLRTELLYVGPTPSPGQPLTHVCKALEMHALREAAERPISLAAVHLTTSVVDRPQLPDSD